MEYEIRKRMIPAKNGQSPLRTFDGATMASYAFPGKATEVVFCRQHPDLLNCKRGHGFDLEKENLSLATLEPRAADGKSGVYASRDISRSSYVGLENAVHGVYIKSGASNLLRIMSTIEAAMKIRKMMTYITLFGHQQRRSVSVGLLSASITPFF